MLHNDYAVTGGEYHSVRSELDGLRQLGVVAELVNVSNQRFLAQGKLRLAEEAISGRAIRASVREAIERVHPDIVHVQNLFPLMGGKVIDLLREYRLPWVRSLRNYRIRCVAGTCFRDGQLCVDCESAGRGIPGVRHACYRDSTVQSAAAVAYAAREHRATSAYPPSAYILLSEAMRPMLESLIGTVCAFVKPNPVQGDLESSPIPRMRRSDEFVFVGRISPEKGVERLVRDFAAHPRLRLTLVGEGGLPADLLRAAPNVKCVGPLPHEQALARMRTALSVIVPSRWAEPFGRVAAESLAVGTPPLVAATGGLTEMVKPIANGDLLVAPIDDWSVSARGIRQMPAPLYDELTAACRSRWRATYRDSVVAEQLIQIYRAALQDSQSETAGGAK